MGDKDWFGALKMRVCRHDCAASGIGLLDELLCPNTQVSQKHINAEANVESQVRCDLLVAASPGVQLETQVANPLGQSQLDKVVYVFCLSVATDVLLLIRIGLAYVFEPFHYSQTLVFGEHSGSEQSKRMSSAGGELCVKQLPVEAHRALPVVKERIGRAAKTARPHLPGLLFIGHCFRHTSRYSFSVALLSLGISLPLLRVSRPAAA